MFTVRLLRREGVRIPADEVQKNHEFHGDFIVDQSSGARRLRLKNPWTGSIAPVELYEPNLVAAQGGTQRWRGYEKVGEQGVVQEWLVRQSD